MQRDTRSPRRIRLGKSLLVPLTDSVSRDISTYIPASFLDLMNSRSFSIKSSSSDREIVFFDFCGGYFTVKLLGSELSAIKRVWAYTDFEALVQLLEDLAVHERNWDGTVEWGSIEADLYLAFRADSLGHVFVEVEISNPADWKLNCEIPTELGQLPLIAQNARQFYSQACAAESVT